jgi:hypothetical protein
MGTLPELLQALDAFVGVQKRLVGTDGPIKWGPGHSRYEKLAQFPIEVNGELIEGARLEVVGLVTEGIQFRLSLCYNAAIARLDHTDEMHPNTRREEGDGLPPDVTGPHYHSWPINRRFFRGGGVAPKLELAQSFTSQGNFDSNLRWFCGDLNIEQPDGRHVIELPRREVLL